MTYRLFLCYDCAGIMRRAFGAEKLSRGDESGKCAKCGRQSIGARYAVRK